MKCLRCTCMYLWSVQWLKLCVDLYCYKYFHVQFMEVLYMWLQVNFVIPLSGCWNLELFPHNLSTILFESLWYRLLLALDYVLVVLHDHGCSLILCLQKPFQCCFSHFSIISGNITCERSIKSWVFISLLVVNSVLFKLKKLLQE